MTVLPQHRVSLLTIEEYAGLGETEQGYTELVEGRVLVSPSPTFGTTRRHSSSPFNFGRSYPTTWLSSKTSMSICNSPSPISRGSHGGQISWLCSLQRVIASNPRVGFCVRRNFCSSLRSFRRDLDGWITSSSAGSMRMLGSSGTGSWTSMIRCP